jgi:hypothetical protein
MPPISLKHIISLDLETTGLDVGKHVPISIGAVKTGLGCDRIDSENSFYIQLEWDSLVVNPKALQINRVNIVDPPGRDGPPFHDRSMPAPEGINAFAKWLGKPEYGFPMFALGKNVGSFDLLMLKSIWNIGSLGMCPSPTPWPFHYRSIDLNTLFMVISEITNYPFDEVKDRISNQAWAKTHHLFENTFERQASPHHALSDAWWNVFAWEACIESLENPAIRC